jgi:hypothetical protein
MHRVSHETGDSWLSEPFCELDHRAPETIQLDCPIDCLRSVLSANALCPLERACSARFTAPRTVRDVVELHRRGMLTEIRGLGQRRIGEIDVCLIYIGALRIKDSAHHKRAAR